MWMLVLLLLAPADDPATGEPGLGLDIGPVGSSLLDVQADVDANISVLAVDVSIRTSALPEPAAAAEPDAETAEPKPRGPTARVGPLVENVAASAGLGLAGLLALVLAQPRWLRLLVPMFSRIQEGELARHPYRAAILTALEADPGATVGELAGRIGVAKSTITYHLHLLGKAGLIVQAQDGKSTRNWIEADPEARLRDGACLMRHDGPRRLARLVADRPWLHQRGLCAETGLSPPVASKHLRRMEEAGLVEAIAQGRTKKYASTPRLDRLLAVHG